MKLYLKGQMVLPALERVTLEKSRSEAAATLTATVLLAPADTYFFKPTLAVGDPVRLLDDGGEEVFLGSVHQLDRTPEKVTLTAYDRGVFLTRNELHGVFSGTGADICRQTAAKLGIPVGEVDDDGQWHTIVTKTGQSAFSILRQAVGEDREVSLRDGTLRVRRCGGTPVALAPERVLDISCRAGIREMVDRCVVVGRNGSVAATAENAADIKAYGRFQTVRAKTGDDPAGQARAALRGRTLSAEVTVLGDLAVRCGGAVELHRPQWGLDGVYAVTAAEHRWEAGILTTAMSLEAMA